MIIIINNLTMLITSNNVNSKSDRHWINYNSNIIEYNVVILNEVNLHMLMRLNFT